MPKNKRGRQADAPMPPDERMVVRNIIGGIELSRETANALTKGIHDPKKRKYLIALAMLGNRTRAAQAIGITPLVPWLWRKEDEEGVFKQRYEQAIQIAAELHEDEMYRRASEGVLEPVYQGGRLVGSVRKFSDTLLIFALKGAMPEKYADRQKLEHSGNIGGADPSRLRAARDRALKAKKEKR